MKCLVDTSVWSQAFRRRSRRETEEVRKLEILLKGGERIFVAGVIVQEILQGIRQPEQFRQVQEALSFFPILATAREDHVFAAELFNLCRAKGVQASTIDFLIASLAIRNDCALLTSDRDFQHIAKHTELSLL